MEKKDIYPGQRVTINYEYEGNIFVGPAVVLSLKPVAVMILEDIESGGHKYKKGRKIYVKPEFLSERA